MRLNVFCFKGCAKVLIFIRAVVAKHVSTEHYCNELY
jgi:hypothetical protein